jgi:hypothetical protein
MAPMRAIRTSHIRPTPLSIFDQYGDEIWEMAVEEAENMGCKNVAEMIAGFKRADRIGSLAKFKNLMVWYAVERLAREEDG